MAFNSFASSFNDRVHKLSSTVAQTTVELPSLAQTTQRKMQEKLGQVTDITELPEEYQELEKRVNSLKLVYEHFLKVTAIYENESYDYPKDVRESLSEFSATVSNKIQELSQAVSKSSAQSYVEAKEPHTLNHALAKTANSCSEELASFDKNGELSGMLQKYAECQTSIADSRLQQDKSICLKFNSALKEQLQDNWDVIVQDQKAVEYKRLQYDVARAHVEQAKPEKKATLRVQMEILEEELTQVITAATTSMQNFLAHSNFKEILYQLALAQATYYESSASMLQKLVKDLEQTTSAPSAAAEPFETPEPTTPEGEVSETN